MSSWLGWVWAAMWPNVFAPSAIGIAVYVFCHIKATRLAKKHHAESQALAHKHHKELLEARKGD